MRLRRELRKKIMRRRDGVVQAYHVRDSVTRQEALDLIAKLNRHAWVPIKDVSFAAELITQRMKKSEYEDPVFDHLSDDFSSTKLFRRQEDLTDPTLGVFMVRTSYLNQPWRMGNRLRYDPESLASYLRDGGILGSAIGYSVKEGKVLEGNHRVKALVLLEYRSIPVSIWGGWD
jgi:hypothetical protein